MPGHNTDLFVLAALCCCAATPAFAANRIYPLISYECDTQADVMNVTHSLLKGDEGPAFEYLPEQGLFSPWDMVEIDRKPDHTTIIRSSKIERRCALSSGEYDLVLEPHIFSHDLTSSCGENISGAVTIHRDGETLLQRTPFENYCIGNAPIVIRVTVFGKTGEYKIKRIPKYRFY